MRFFRATLAIEAALREQVRIARGQPNGAADRPWSEGGDFQAEGLCYLALGPHHYESPPWSDYVVAALAAGAEEIDAETYFAARPQPETPL